MVLKISQVVIGAVRQAPVAGGVTSAWPGDSRTATATTEGPSA